MVRAYRLTVPGHSRNGLVEVDSQRALFLSGAPAEQMVTVEWTTHEWLHFLRKLPATLSATQMKKLDDAYNLTNTGNSEIADLWYVLSVRVKYSKAYPAMDNFLSSVGRRKFLEPLYREMMKTTDGAAMARRIYAKYRKNYHPLAQEMIDRIVEKKG